VTALAVLGGLVVLSGWNSFFLAPEARAKAAVEKDLSAARTQEQTLRQNLAQLRRLADDTKSREAELARLGKLVPADPDVAGAILALNDTANQAQVAWASFVPTPPAAAAGGGSAAIGVSMKVGGTFNQVFDYLRRLESLDRLVVVDSLQLTGSNGTTGSSKVDADIKGRMFSTGGTPAPPATASPAAATTVAAGGATTAAGSTALPKAGG
jgi:Tfp pilus assembly protein PilO